MSTRQTRDARANEIDRLFERHRRADFPDRLPEERAGVEVTLLDADPSGLVRTWLHDGGRPDPAQRAVVRACLQDLDRLLPELTDVHERRYVGRLRRLAGLLAEAGG